VPSGQRNVAATHRGLWTHFGQPETPLIDLIEFGRYYRQLWKTVAITFALCALFGVTYFLVATPLYRAQVTLQFHAASQQNEGLSATLGIGLALAGLQGDRSLPERAEGFGILKSRAFLLPFIQKMNLAPSIFPDRFDTSTKSLKRDKKAPTQEDLHRAFRDRVMVVDDNFSTGLITISIFLPNAETAANVANALVADLNETLRLNTIARANENIAYLEKQLASNQVAEIRISTAQLIQSEMKRLLLASGQMTHAFQQIDPAVTPDRIYAPRPLLIAAFAFLSAFLISLFVVLVRFLARSRVP
jgi:uncharacterized protein involved in exopolysaccharide biosynthesis